MNKILNIIFLFISTLLYASGDHDHTGHGHYHEHSGHNKNNVKGSIRGIVVDKLTDLPKEFASISIIKSHIHDGSMLHVHDETQEKDIITGGITNSDGNFYIDEILPGNYELLVEYIGYEKLVVENIKIEAPSNLTVDVGSIKIEPKMLLLEDVSVVESPIIEEVAKTIYPVAETARESGGTADEVLEQLPGLSVDIDGNLTLRGDSNVTILIDGRKSKISLDMLNANMIDKVEVMTTPSAKYDPDGIAGIINIILVKNEYVGKSGKLGFNIDSFEGINLSGSYNIFKNAFNLFTNFSYKQKHKDGNGYRKTWYIHKPGEDFSQSWMDGLPYTVIDYSEMETENYRHPENINFKIGSEKYFDENSMIAFDLTYFDSQNTDTSYVSLYQKEINEPSSTTNTVTITNGDGSSLNYGLGYFYDNPDNNSSLSILFDYDDHDENESIEYIDSNLYSEITDWGEVKVFSADYSSPINNAFPFFEKIFSNKIGYNKDSIFEFGAKKDIENNIHALDIANKPFLWTYDNNISAIYFNASYNLSKSFGFQFGGRFEEQDKNFIINSEFLDENNCNVCSIFNDYLVLKDLTDGVDFNYNHERIYPSLYFIYNDNKGGTYKMGLARRINRPGHWSLNPIPDLEDFSSGFISVGNSSIIPEDINKIEISYSGRTSIGFFKTSIFADNVTNKIDRYKYTEIINGEEYQVLSWTNIGESEGFGMDFTVMTRPLPKWDLMLYGNYWNNKYIKADDEDKLGRESGFWGMITSKIKIDKKQQISIYSHLSSPMKITTGTIKPMKRMDLSYKRKVSDNFNFTLKLKDVFDTSGFSIETYGEENIFGTYSVYSPENDYNYSIDYETLHEYLDGNRRRQGRFISLNVEYKFGEYKENKKYRRDGAGHGHSHSHDDGMDQGY